MAANIPVSTNFSTHFTVCVYAPLKGFTHVVLHPLPKHPSLCHPLPSGKFHTVVFHNGLSIHNMTTLFTSFDVVPSSHFDETAAHLLPVALPLFLFCSSVYCVHLISHIHEIIETFSFTAWLISLNIIVSRFINAVSNGTISYLSIAVSYFILKM